MPARQSFAVNRRQFLAGAAGIAGTAALSACAKGATASGADLSNPLPTRVPAGTKLSIASGRLETQTEFTLSGLVKDLPFTVPSWPNLSAGPDVINAFRAKSLDLATNAGIPPIQAHYQKYDARIVAVELTRKPTYVFATKPHSDIQSTKNFAGKKLAFSQGQAQGVVLLRALKNAGIKDSDVTLVPLTSDQFLTALQASQVDVAPLGISQIHQYLDKYGKDGAHEITTDVVDLLTVLWAPADVLADKAKAAAIAAYIPIWAKAEVWVYEHPEIWAQKYYVKTQGVDAAEASDIIKRSNKPMFPPSWDEAISWEQETSDLLAEGGFVKKFKVDSIFDRRFESLAANAVSATYRR